MMDYDGKEVREDFEKEFNLKMIDLSPKQLWWLVKVIKHCRGRCRNNSALLNYLNRNFGPRFKEVSKSGECYKCHGKGCVACNNTGQYSYEGLDII